MPLSACYGLFTLALVVGIFLVLYRIRGWKIALGVSLLTLMLMVVLFMAFLTFALRAMG